MNIYLDLMCDLPQTLPISVRRTRSWGAGFTFVCRMGRAKRRLGRAGAGSKQDELWKQYDERLKKAGIHRDSPMIEDEYETRI